MIDKNFAEVAVGTTFTHNSIQYIKTEKIRVSCCQSINAKKADDDKVKIFVSDDTVVKVNA